jgi:hypothetical protein
MKLETASCQVVIGNISGDTNATVKGTLAGAPGSSINSIASFNNNVSSGSNYDLFFNSLEITSP